MHRKPRKLPKARMLPKIPKKEMKNWTENLCVMILPQGKHVSKNILSVVNLINAPIYVSPLEKRSNNI
jgi:uncharacterized heparinase superfamily protein